TSSSSDLRVDIAIGDDRHSFNAGTGTDLGDYPGPGFVQRNIRVRDPKIPFTVYFRPDKNSDRVEIVFEWGDVLAGEPRHLDAYTASISKGGSEIAHVDVPYHYWLSRWRWQSAPRPIVKSAAELVASKMVPPYSSIATVAIPEAAPPYTVMGLSDV